VIKYRYENVKGELISPQKGIGHKGIYILTEQIKKAKIEEFD
jgi:hypothetical protein